MFLTEMVDRENLYHETSDYSNYSKCYEDWLRKHEGSFLGYCWLKIFIVVINVLHSRLASDVNNALGWNIKSMCIIYMKQH